MNSIHRQEVSASRVPSLVALTYQPDNFHCTTDVGTLSVECSHSGALKFPEETESFAVRKGMFNWSHSLKHSNSCSTCMKVKITMAKIF